jgi:hypothetical protein
MIAKVTSSMVTISHISTPPGGSDSGRLGAGVVTRP